MHARLSSRLATFGLIGVATVTACKSEAPTSNSGTDSFATPMGLLSVGDLVNLNVNIDDACTNPIYHPARVVAVGSRSVIFADTLNPKNGFSTADYQRFAAKFDTLIYPLDVANFGDPTDVDKNGGRISIIFTRVVNEATPPRSSQFVGGLAYSRDLFPKVGNAGGRATTCAGSNEGEYFYALTPDPSGVVNSNVRTTGFVDSNTTAVLVHEFEHIINSSRRLYVNNATAFEEKWLDEGLAHIAEELLFYREAGLGPRLNLDVMQLRASARITSAFNLEMSGNLSRYRSYLTSPSLNSPYAPNDSLPTRGAAWSLLRYSLDRVNATDNFTPGNGQVASATGDVVLSPGATPGDYIATVVNTTLQSTTTTTGFTIKSTSTSGDVISAGSGVPSYLQVPLPGASEAPQRDEAFEARIRAKERAALTPLMSGARAWYAARVASGNAVSPSRSLSSIGVVDADGTLLFKLVNNNLVGLANYQTIVGGDAAGFVRDWAVSHAIDDVAALTTQYQQRSWNWHSIYPAVIANGAYPLAIQTLAANGTVTSALAPGGSAYYRISVAANGSATLNLGPAGSTSSNLQLVVVRTK